MGQEEEKKILKSVGAKTQHSFTPLFIHGAHHAFVVGDNHWSMSVDEHPIFSRSWNRPFLITRWNALVRSIKARYSGLSCSRDFSCSWRTVTIMSVVDLPVRKQHGDLGYTAVSHCLQSDKEQRGRQLCRQYSWEKCLDIQDSCYSLFRLSGRLCSYRAWWWWRHACLVGRRLHSKLWN